MRRANQGAANVPDVRLINLNPTVEEPDEPTHVPTAPDIDVPNDDFVLDIAEIHDPNADAFNRDERYKEIYDLDDMRSMRLMTIFVNPTIRIISLRR